MDPSALAPADAVELAHALVARVGDKLGARVLLIKGPGAAHHGLRGERVSADADGWVEPAAADRMLERLADVGWAERPGTELSHEFATHSVTLVHPRWPCDIDLHTRFPGFLADPATVFDALWARRATLILAGIEVAIPDRTGAILIAALHALRTPAQTPRHAGEVRLLLNEVLPALDDAALADLRTLAEETGCLDTARPVLEAFVTLPPPTPARADAALDAWRMRTGGLGTASIQHWQIVMRAPWRRRPGMLWRATWRPEADFRIEHPEVGPGRAALNRARLARLGRGLRMAPRIVTGTVRARLGRTDRTLTRGARGGR